jgi:hypothetical protein
MLAADEDIILSQLVRFGKNDLVTTGRAKNLLDSINGALQEEIR